MQTVEYFDNRLLEYSMIPEEIEINASDEKRIKLGAFVRWRIVDPLAFARATRTAGIGGNRISTMNLQLQNLLGSAMRQVIGAVPLNALLSPERDRIMHDIREIMENQASSSSVTQDVSGSQAPAKVGETRSGFGIEIVDVRIVKADLPDENSQAIFSRMKTERERQAAKYRAEAGKNPSASMPKRTATPPSFSPRPKNRRRYCAARAMPKPPRFLPKPSVKIRNSLILSLDAGLPSGSQQEGYDHRAHARKPVPQGILKA